MSKHRPRVRKARPLLVASGVALLGLAGCGTTIGNPGFPAADLSVTDTGGVDTGNVFGDLAPPRGDADVDDGGTHD